MVPATLARIVSHSSASKEALCTNRTHTHYARGEKDHACIPMHTHDISSGSQRCRGMLRGLPSGGPCRPGCKEAGWQSRVWRHLLKRERTPVGCGHSACGVRGQKRELWGGSSRVRVGCGTHQPMSHGRPEGPWAGLGRVVGTASGMVLQASLAGGAWGGSPGRSVQGSWVAHLGAAGKGHAPQWWPWWWSQPLQRESQSGPPGLPPLPPAQPNQGPGQFPLPPWGL